MAGKWEKFLQGLPKFKGNDPTFQDRVTEVKRRILANVSEVNGASKVDYDETLKDFDTCAEDLQDLLFRFARHRHASTFAAGYRAARLAKERLEEHVKMLSTFEQAYTEMFIDQAENEDVSSMKLDTGDSLRVQHEPFASVEDRDKFREWCLENGYERELQLPWQTTNSLAKERLEAGEPEPPGIKLYHKEKVVFTRASKK